MPKTGDLVRRLRRAGFVLLRHGGNHDIWENPQTGKRAVVARHSTDIPNGTYLSVIRQAGLSDDED